MTADPNAAAGAPASYNEAPSRFALLGLLSCIAIWGINAVAFRVGTQPERGVGFDPVMLNGLRFLLVAPLLWLYVRVRQPAALQVPDRRDLWRYALYGVISIFLSESLLTLSVQYTSVANMSLLGPGTIALFTALWSVALGEQKLTRAGWIGAGIALGGVGLVASASGGGFRFDTQSLIGDGIALGRSVIQGGYLIFLSRTLREKPVLTVTVYNVLFGTLAFLPYVAYKSVGFPWSQVSLPVWGAILWTVIPTTLYGFVVWNEHMPRVGAVAATNLFYLLPVFAAVGAWAILGEPPTVAQLAGGAVIVAGIVVLRWDAMVGSGALPSLTGLRLPWRR